jgi:choline dehydrogenase
VGNFFTFLGVLEHPFSRGSTRIKSADQNVCPSTDPRYLSHPFDLAVLSKIALHLQVIAKTPPLSTLLVNNGTSYQPGYYALNENNFGDLIKKNLQSEYHPAGTCAVLSRDEGGVVDAKFKVYGADGLRVVDASIFPMLPRGNLQTLVYAIAERAADWIKEDIESI